MQISKGCATVQSFFYTQNQIEMAQDVHDALNSKGVKASFEVYFFRGEWLGYVVRFVESLDSVRTLAAL